MKMRLAAMALLAGWASPAAAQVGSPWQDEPFWDRPTSRYRDFEPDGSQGPRRVPLQQGAAIGEAVRDGGPRPAITPRAPPVVAFEPDYPAGSIVIDTSGRMLYFVLPGRQAFQYPISVGREGFAWAGTEKISRKQAWPDWHPPAEMRKRDPKLPVRMTGGLKNPLGAMALYLGNSLYRIHGTNDEKTIGYASSSGCFRMMNASVVHLAQFAQVGTSVTVINRLPNAPPPPVAQTRPRQAPPLAQARPRAEPPPVAPPRAPPPARFEPPPSRYDPPPVARQPLPPPVATADEDFDRSQPPRPYRDRDEDIDRSWPEQRPARHYDRHDDEVADVRVEPSDVDDYDPYVSRPFERRRPYRDRFAGRSFDRDRDPPPSYADEPNSRLWYDDERDDY